LAQGSKGRGTKREIYFSSIEARGRYEFKSIRLDDCGNIGARWVAKFIFVKKIHAYSSQAPSE